MMNNYIKEDPQTNQKVLLVKANYKKIAMNKW